MAKNKSGTYVHVHTDAGTIVVAPGDDFPEGAEYDPILARDPEADDDVVEVAGPSQRPITVTSTGPEEWRGVTVPQLRDGLAAREVEFDSSDRKDALVAKATEAGLTPADFNEE